VAPPPASANPPVLHKAPPPATVPQATPPFPPAPETKRAGTGRAKSPRKTERRALKEMLGFVEEQATASPAGPPALCKEAERRAISFGEPGRSPPVATPPVFESAPPSLGSAPPVFEPAPPALEPVSLVPPRLHDPADENVLEAESVPEDVEPTMGE